MMILNSKTYATILLLGILLICMVCLTLRWRSLAATQEPLHLGLQRTAPRYLSSERKETVESNGKARADSPGRQAESGTGSAGKASRANDQDHAEGKLLDLNAATTAELEELPGIGSVIAGRILSWREEHGKFSSVEQLVEVEGIGPATLERLRPYVIVANGD